MITKPRKIRLEYRFARELDADEVELLAAAICWRKGSSIVRDESGAAHGCIAHCDDFGEFRKQLRQRGVRIGWRVVNDRVGADDKVLEDGK